MPFAASQATISDKGIPSLLPSISGDRRTSPLEFAVDYASVFIRFIIIFGLDLFGRGQRGAVAAVVRLQLAGAAAAAAVARAGAAGRGSVVAVGYLGSGRARAGDDDFPEVPIILACRIDRGSGDEQDRSGFGQRGPVAARRRGGSSSPPGEGAEPVEAAESGPSV